MPTYTYNLAPQHKWKFWKKVITASPIDTNTFTVNTTTDIITLDSATNFLTGKAVQIFSSGTLPAPLVDGSVYYLIFVTTSTFKLATTISNALAGTAINLTSAGTGTLTMVNNGQVFNIPLSGGFVYTYSSLDHTINKTTYLDPLGASANTNPIVLDANGEAVIYWAINADDATDNYYVEVYDANGVLVDAWDDFNAAPLEQASILNDQAITNHVRNPQFTYWKMYDYNAIGSYSGVVSALCTTMPSAGVIETANEWFFDKNNNLSTDTVSRQQFIPGQTDVPGDPPYYMQVQCTANGGSETFKQIYQKYNDVNSFAGQTINVSVYANSAQAGTQLGFHVQQYFGSGGSADVVTSFPNTVLTTGWVQYDFEVAVPSVSGKTIGTGSYFYVSFDMPVNATFTINLAAAQITNGEALNDFQYITLEEQLQTLPYYSQANTGDIQISLSNIGATYGTPRTWLRLEDGTIGNASSNATLRANPDTSNLFQFLWNIFPDGICRVYNSAGVKVARGVSATADFAANNQITFFANEARAIANSGVPSLVIPVASVDTGADTITLTNDEAINLSLFTGTAVQISSTLTLPAPLVAATNYYVIPVSVSPTVMVIKLATSIANALAGTQINITTAGTGIILLNAIYSYTLADGQSIGQENHIQIVSELASHDHNFTGGGTPASGGPSWEGAVPDTANTTTKTGTNTPFNIIQPTLYLPYMIKL